MENILTHYSDDIEITSPMIKLAGGIDSGTLKGKVAVKEYWHKALNKITDLHFNLIQTVQGIDSVTIYYTSVMNKPTIEVMFFDEEGKVNKVFAHYN